MSDSNGYPGAPRWVKLAWICTIAVALFFAFLLHAGMGSHHAASLHGGH